mmetsp:Transcript_149184/g.278117  ORF Transcript_149184/g.278117 Transcript_149184/m.278117 type:complete len:107 (-) Transcript_149184:1551-1871(-)
MATRTLGYDLAQNTKACTAKSTRTASSGQYPADQSVGYNNIAQASMTTMRFSFTVQYLRQQNWRHFDDSSVSQVCQYVMYLQNYGDRRRVNFSHGALAVICKDEQL